MSKGRLEAFSDGVIAILITIMVLELRSRTAPTARARCGRSSRSSCTYVLSFVFLGIYWNNHHHLLHAADAGQRRDPVGEPAPAVLAVAGPVRHRLDGREPLRPAAHRGLRRACCSGRRSPTTILEQAIPACQPPESVLARAIGRDTKGNLSLAIYAAAVPLTFLNRWMAIALFALVALLWLVLV